MATRHFTFVTLSITALLTSGCSMMPFGRDEPRAVVPEPLAAAPTGAVTASPLPPPGSVAAIPPPASGLAALDPSQQTTTPVVATPGNVEVGRTDLLGGWTVSAAGESCQLFMTLTTWAGGYRASTRGCANQALQKVSAWNMEGAQVQLLNDSGATVARLYPQSKTQFSGQTEGGGPVTVSR